MSANGGERKGNTPALPLPEETTSASLPVAAAPPESALNGPKGQQKKRTGKRAGKSQRAAREAAVAPPRAYLIRIPGQADQERALVAFDRVREPVHSVAEDEFLVTPEHLNALRGAAIPFEDVTEARPDHGEEKAG